MAIPTPVYPQNPYLRTITEENKQDLDLPVESEQLVEPEYVELTDAQKAEISKSWTELYQTSEKVEEKVVTQSEISETKVELSSGTISFERETVESIEIAASPEAPRSDEGDAEEKFVDFGWLMGASKEKAKGVLGTAEGGVKKSLDTTKEVSGSIFDLFKYIAGKADLEGKSDQHKKQETDPEKIKKENEKKKKKGIMQMSANIIKTALSSVSAAGKRRVAQMARGANKQVGLSDSFEGSLNDDGSIRVDLQTFADKKNSELEDHQIKRVKQMRVAQARNAGINLNKIAEGGSALSTTGGAGAG